MDSQKTDDFNEIYPRKVSILLGLGILFFPIIFSWFTLKKGYSNLSKIISFSWLIITFIITLVPINSKSISNNENLVSTNAENINISNENIPKNTSVEDTYNESTIALDSNTPNLNKFYDLNSRDIKHSLVYWSLVNTDGADYTDEDLYSIFIPEIYNEHSPFEKEKIVTKFSNEYPKIQKHLASYKDIKYVSIPIYFKEPNEKWITYARKDKAKSIYFDAEKNGFYNFCPIDFVAQGPAYGDARGAVARDHLPNSFDNRSMTILYKKNKYDDSLCFLSVNDKVKAESIYNANMRDSLLVKGKVYLKISSITNPENESKRFYFYDDKGGTTYEKTNQLVAEILAIDLELFDNYDDQENPSLIYKELLKSSSFYK